MHIIGDPLVYRHLTEVDRCSQLLLPVQTIPVKLDKRICSDEFSFRRDYKGIYVNLEQVSLQEALIKVLDHERYPRPLRNAQILGKLRQVDEVYALLIVDIYFVYPLRVKLLQPGRCKTSYVRVLDDRVASLPVVGDAQVVLLIDFEMLHHEHTIAHESVFVPWQDQVLAKHLIGDCLDLVDGVTDVDS